MPQQFASVECGRKIGHIEKRDRQPGFAYTKFATIHFTYGTSASFVTAIVMKNEPWKVEMEIGRESLDGQRLQTEAWRGISICPSASRLVAVREGAKMEDQKDHSATG